MKMDIGKMNVLILDFNLLTQQFGIAKKEITFVEDVWEGGGSFRFIIGIFC